MRMIGELAATAARGRIVGIDDLVRRAGSIQLPRSPVVAMQVGAMQSAKEVAIRPAIAGHVLLAGFRQTAQQTFPETAC